PADGEAIPVGVAASVLMECGTGAIMAVPAHDERDFEFARGYDLPIRRVVAPRDGAAADDRAYTAHTEDEVLVNSDRFTGMSAVEASARSSSGCRARAAARAASPSGCATGCSRASATGAARSRSSTATCAGSCRYRTTSC